ncbi:MAG: prolyl oligopeptidase family serine peptidase [Isosphaeraceae bacterium]|nr:prolyl oligopeptidase family serine peptidase [Isosphaeraceae bacterium]
MIRLTPAAIALILALTSLLQADGPADNVPSAVRRVPKLGIEVPPQEREELKTGLDKLGTALRGLETSRDPKIQRLLGDVRIYSKAVHDALEYQEFFAPAEIAKANELLKEGLERAEALKGNSAPWAEKTGLVVRGYVSKLDDSVQPYGLVIPESYSPKGPRVRLDVWFHGRGETLSEVNFLDERRKQAGPITPEDTIVLHPYGRYCNAFKFAGEVDVLEAIEDVRKRYHIDDDRIAVRGFSMGGAACWQFAVHYGDRWFAANPGAGFSETPRFLKVFQHEDLKPTWYEQKLWHLYDCTDTAVNIYQCPTIAYSGELDSQKQAAEVMAEAVAAEGLTLRHVIGPQTKHAIHPESKREIETDMSSLARRGRIRTPAKVHFATYTLRYNRANWVTLDALGEHWAKARVSGSLTPRGPEIVTENVEALTLDFEPGAFTPEPGAAPRVTVDGTTVEGPRPRSDDSWRCELHREGKTWKLGPPSEGLRKRHGLQGPIDDAFMDTFLVVRPTGDTSNGSFGSWSKQERERAVEHWRRHFRGQARVKDDTAVTDADIASANLVLWGDPASNAVLRRIADRLPITWDRDHIKAGDRQYASAHHALAMVYPNPLNPNRYVVLNSGFTFREYDYLNNARQTPKLPDWAVIDLRTPPDARFPGKVVDAGFFGERWELKPTESKN